MTPLFSTWGIFDNGTRPQIILQRVVPPTLPSPTPTNPPPSQQTKRRRRAPSGVKKSTIKRRRTGRLAPPLPPQSQN